MRQQDSKTCRDTTDRGDLNESYRSPFLMRETVLATTQDERTANDLKRGNRFAVDLGGKYLLIDTPVGSEGIKQCADFVIRQLWFLL